MVDLHGKVALVTGSSSGIGEAIARGVAARGAKVVLNSTSSVTAGERVAGELPDATYVQADIDDPNDAARLVAATVERYGRLDILVNNAGTTETTPHHDLNAATFEVWERIMRVNVLGTWNVVRAAVPHLPATATASSSTSPRSPTSDPSARRSRTRHRRRHSTT